MKPEGFEILYEDGPCMIVSKPGGLLTQAPRGIDSLEVRIKDFLIARENKPGKAYLGVPHRLDRPVSGALVVCKHVRAARRVSAQFESRTVEKRYWAIVEGRIKPSEATWTDTMRKIPDVAKAELVPPDHVDAREAVLHYRILSTTSEASLLEFELQTGRMHQIRLQAATHGHPVWGDELYGSQRRFGPETAEPRDRWIALHAVSLGLHHPMTRLWVQQRAPLPEPWRNADLPAEIADQLATLERSHG